MCHVMSFTLKIIINELFYVKMHTVTVVIYHIERETKFTFYYFFATGDINNYAK